MDEKERKVVMEVLREMRDSYTMIRYWLRGSPIEQTLGRWIRSLESLLVTEVK